MSLKVRTRAVVKLDSPQGLWKLSSWRSVLVSPGCYSKTPQKILRWVINNGMYLLKFWSLGDWGWGSSMVRFWWGSSSRLQTASFLMYSPLLESREEASSLTMLIRALIPFVRTPSLWCHLIWYPTPWPSDVKSQLIRKDPDAGKDWRQEEKRMTED